LRSVTSYTIVTSDTARNPNQDEVMVMNESEALEHLALASRLSGFTDVALALPASRQCIAGRMRLHYLDWGRQGAPPVLFLHGGCLTAHTWDLACLALRNDYHCLALDQRGHGDSEWSPEVDYRPSAQREDVAGWIDALGMDRPVLVGQSMGALNALSYAHAFPERVAGLVLIDIAPEASRSGGAARIVEFARAPAELDSIDAFVERAVAFNPRRRRELLRSSLLHNLRQLPDGRLTWKYDRRFLATGMTTVANALEELATQAREVSCPTLLVRGGDSDVVTREAAAAFAACFPAGQFAEVAGAGHSVQGDEPAALVALLRRFLAAVCA
jgi:esterase